MLKNARHGEVSRLTVLAALSIVVALGAAGSSRAEEGDWTLQIELLYMEAYGQDQHVLTIRENDLDAIPAAANRTAVNLGTDSTVARRLEFQSERGQWGWGADFFWCNTSQSAADRTAAAEGPSGTIDEIVFEIADQEFVSSNPDEVLYYDLLGDTDLALWTLDFYGMRTLAEKADSNLRMRFGLRVGDFDNDYRAVIGIQDVVGTLLGASSNYDRMMGPIVGLDGEVRRGKNRIETHIAQSVLIGSVELTSTADDFTGPVATPSFFDQEKLSNAPDVAIPVTDFRLKWTRRINNRVSVGAGVHTSVWWDVSVPPGVIPGEDGDTVLHKNTIVLSGLSGTVELRF